MTDARSTDMVHQAMRERRAECSLQAALIVRRAWGTPAAEHPEAHQAVIDVLAWHGSGVDLIRLARVLAKLPPGELASPAHLTAAYNHGKRNNRLEDK